MKLHWVIDVHKYIYGLVAKEGRYVAVFIIIYRNISKHKRKHFRKGIRKRKKKKE